MFRLESILYDGAIPVYTDDGHTLKVYDNPKYSRIVERYEEDSVHYAVVKFNHPDNPPSNQTRYVYLDPKFHDEEDING